MAEPMKIKSMYVFVSENKDGDEGVIGHLSPNGMWMPFVGADLDRMASLRPGVDKIVRETGMKVKLLHFSVREELDMDKIGSAVH